VREVNYDIKDAHELLSGLITAGDPPKAVPPAFFDVLVADSKITELARRVMTTADSCAGQLDAAARSGTVDVEQLAAAGDKLRDAVEAFREAARIAISTAVVVDADGNLRRAALALTDTGASRINRRNIERMAGAAEVATGKAGAKGAFEYFEKVASSERWIAEILRGLAVVALLAISIAAYNNPMSAADPVNTALTHLPYLLPAAVLAGYLVKESARHRAVARAATGLAVRLRTLDAYIERLDDENQEKVRMNLAAVIFATPQPLDETAIKGLYDDVTAMLERIAEAFTAAAGAAKDKLEKKPD
jgi:hypothetical protein